MTKNNMEPMSVSSPGAFPIDDLQEKLAPVTMGCAHPSCRTQSNRREDLAEWRVAVRSGAAP